MFQIGKRNNFQNQCHVSMRLSDKYSGTFTNALHGSVIHSLFLNLFTLETATIARLNCQEYLSTTAS